MNIFTTTSKEKKLWEWFNNHLKKFESEDINDPIYAEFHKRLANIHSSLVFEISAKSKSTRTLVISCDGIKDGISSVEKVVASAPNMHGWEVVAFRQPIKEPVTLEFDNIKLSTDDIKFDYQEVPNDMVDVVLYINGVNDKNKEDYLRASFLMLDATIGEFLAMTKIRHLDLLPMPTNVRLLRSLPGLLNIIS